MNPETNNQHQLQQITLQSSKKKNPSIELDVRNHKIGSDHNSIDRVNQFLNI